MEKHLPSGGFSFKFETYDMRDASSIIIINELTKRGAKIKAYDSKAMDEVKEFRSPDFDEMKQRLKNSIIFDGGSRYNIEKIKKGLSIIRLRCQKTIRTFK